MSARRVAGPMRAGWRLLALLPALLPAAADAARLTGVIRDRAGKPIEYATVSVVALKKGAVTDTAGRFALEVPEGALALDVAQLGYEKRRVNLIVTAQPAPLAITLGDEPVALAEISVTTSSFGKVGKSEGATLKRMDVLMTPGGAADVFMSLRALPGINAPAEGAALYVRGGAPDETLVRLDGGELGHPYHYEGASGGLFSAIDTYMLKSAFFSSGGFSAKYGGVLSGVLDIETQDPMNLRTVSVGVNFAGGGASTSWALIPDKLSFVGALRAGDPELLFRLYGTSRDWEVAPTSVDGAGRLLYRYSSTGRVSLYYLDTRDDSRLTVPYLSFETPYQRNAHTQMTALQFQDAVGTSLALRGQVSNQRYASETRIGPFGESGIEHHAQANLDATLEAGGRHQLGFGFNLRRRDTDRIGTEPADSTNFAPDAPTRDIRTEPRVAYPGFYAEDKMRVWGPVYATLGARADYASTPGAWTVDPRAALAWRVDDRQTLRVATGRYHQLASAQYLDPVFGNPQLAPLESEHVIAGYEWQSEHSNVRVEAFQKRYRNLVTNDATSFYANGGTGVARGVDVFVQGEIKWLTGHVSYGYLDARRKEFDDPREVPASYGVRHSLSLVGTYQLTSSWHFGARYSVASGRPWTPVTSATYDPVAGIWRPTFAENNSATMPRYQRLDLRAIRLFSLPAGLGLPSSSVCVAYVEALNVLNEKNVLEYTYNQDYSQRIAQDSYFARRMAVFGFSLTW